MSFDNRASVPYDEAFAMSGLSNLLGDCQSPPAKSLNSSPAFPIMRADRGSSVKLELYVSPQIAQDIKAAAKAQGESISLWLGDAAQAYLSSTRLFH